MADAAGHQSFGQAIARNRLDWLARHISASIGDGTPAAWAGFVWARSSASAPQSYVHPEDQRGRPKAA